MLFISFYVFIGIHALASSGWFLFYQEKRKSHGGGELKSKNAKRERLSRRFSPRNDGHGGESQMTKCDSK
jgi:hypothetical protein